MPFVKMEMICAIAMRCSECVVAWTGHVTHEVAGAGEPGLTSRRLVAHAPSRALVESRSRDVSRQRGRRAASLRATQRNAARVDAVLRDPSGLTFAAITAARG